jgi:hypothetical protein
MNMDLDDREEENLKLHRAYKKRSSGFNHHIQANLDMDEDEDEENFMNDRTRPRGIKSSRL